MGKIDGIVKIGILLAKCEPGTPRGQRKCFVVMTDESESIRASQNGKFADVGSLIESAWASLLVDAQYSETAVAGESATEETTTLPSVPKASGETQAETATITDYEEYY